MYKLLLGPALAGAAYAGGAYYGSDAEQPVHKDPDAVYAAVSGLIDHVEPSGTTHFDGGTPTPYEVKVERTPGQRLVVTLLFAGKEGARADIAFMPRNGGSDTLMIAKIAGDRAVLRPVLAGTDKAKLAYAPGWMLNLTARPLLKQLAGEIESGEAVSDPTAGFISQAQWESALPPDQREQVQEWRQYDAARPMVDPNADAQNYMNGGGH
jgi:hypothetical protein